MRIVDVRTVLLTGPSTNDPYLGRTRRSAAFIEILTDTELTGLGETYAGYFIPEAVPSIVDFYKPILVGQNVDDVPALAARLFHTGRYWARTGLGLAVMTGIEAALWDLRGRELGKPVHELLGGRRHDSLLGYATGAGTVYPKPRLADKIDFYLGLGFRAFKIGTGASTPDGEEYEFTEPAEAADFEADKFAFVRDHVGPEVKVLLDGHQDNLSIPGWEVPTALAVVKAVEPFDLFLFEEPLPYTNPWGYGELRGATTVPIAGGETLTGVPEWRVFAEEDAFDIAQPDAAFCGGLGEFLRIAALFEERGRKHRDPRLGRRRRADAERPRGLRRAEHRHLRDPARLRAAPLGDRRRVVRHARRPGPAARDARPRHPAHRRKCATATRSCPAAASSTTSRARSLTDVGYPGLERQAPSAPNAQHPSPADRP